MEAVWKAIKRFVCSKYYYPVVYIIGTGIILYTFIGAE